MTPFAKLFSRTVGLKPSPARMPDGLVVHAVGDIHGRDDLLRELVAKLVGEWCEGSDAPVKPVLVFLGDYIDRGPGSDAVIEYLLSGALAAFETRFLRGNHEAMLLDFLQNGVAGPHWAQIGGADTLRAYGVTPPDRQFDAQAWEQARTNLAGRLPATHLRFLETLEPFAIYGDYCFVHAGLRPGVKLAAQREEDLIWIREEFLNHDRPFEHIVVHGHSAEMEPYRSDVRIGIDTGAFMTGRLTAVRLKADQVTFIQTGAG